jgi:hypothetical protein
MSHNPGHCGEKRKRESPGSKREKEGGVNELMILETKKRNPEKSMKNEKSRTA